MCLLLLNYGYIMAYNTETTSTPLQMSFNKDVSPVWAQLLYKGAKNPGKLKSTLSDVRENPSLLPGAFVGKSLLDKFINPTLDKLLPDSVKTDVLRNKITFSPTKKLDMGLTLEKKSPLLNINWKF